MMTSEESQQQQTSLACAMSDLEGGLHSLTVEARTVLLDDTPADIVEVTAQHIRFATEHGTVACAVDAFGQAVLGGNAPTLGDLGQQLGQNLARWYAETRLTERLRSVLLQVQGTLDEYERERPRLLLPQMRLDPYMARVLESYKGTEESAQAIALVLDRPLEQIRALLGPAAVAMRALADSSPTSPQEQTVQQENTETPTAGSVRSPHEAAPSEALPIWATEPESQATETQSHEKEAANEKAAATEHQPTYAATNGERSAFRWLPVLIKQLRAEVSKEVDTASGATSIAAVARTIAQRYQWPYKAVDYKIRSLHLMHAEQETTALQTVVPDAPTHQEPTADASEQSEPDEHRVQAITAPATGASALSWLSSSSSRQAQDVPALEIGHTMWDVDIEGKAERWLLEYAYGAFPFTRANTRFGYRGQIYDLERAYTSKLKVTTVPVGAEIVREATGAA